MAKTLGILGGMGPLATSALFKKVITMTKAGCDQDHIHQIVDSNPQIPDRTSFILGHGEDPTPYLVSSAKRLERMGADFIIMPCNTAHHFYESISISIGVPLLNMVESTAEFCTDSFTEGSGIGLLATDGTCMCGIYDKYFSKAKVRLLKPDPQFQELVMSFIYEIKEGKGIDSEKLFKAVSNLEGKGAKAFILGCTELSFAADECGFPNNFIDPLDVIAKRAVRLATGQMDKTA